MGFITDRQTLDDLNLVGRFRKDSVINIFDRTKTRYGKQQLEAMFRNPPVRAEEIRDRIREFRYYSGKGFNIPTDTERTDSIEFYLNAHASRNTVLSAVWLIGCRLKHMFTADRNYEKIQEGMRTLADVLHESHSLMKELSAPDSPVCKEATALAESFGGKVLERLASERISGKKTLFNTICLDHLLRIKAGKDVHRMMEMLCHLDVYFSVAQVAEERGFGYAEVLESEERSIDIEGLWHPSLRNAVANDIRIDHSRNVFFLTGVNMAGKSTFMKAVAITVYLAQMGFPIPAKRMAFTPVDGLFTSINVPDNIALGYSHFYAEVLRVKHIAEEVRSGKNLFIIFDELFKGTNVKDAYDATLAVTEAFSRHRNCMYIISTHIVETGTELSARCGNVVFRYFPAGLDGDRPTYPYRLEDGISSDRHGMTIIRNEKILEIIREGTANK